MAKLALTVVGMGIGFALGGPFGAQIGAMIGGMVGNILFAPSVKGPRLSDLTVTCSTYGQVIPELYGTMRLGGNMIWSSGIKEHKHKKGGKGGPKVTTYTYTASFAIAFCKGEIDGVLRMWADGKLISGAHKTLVNDGLTGQQIIASALLNLTGKKHGGFEYRIYTGSEDQLPDSAIEADKGAGNVPAYRGLAYIVFVDMPLDNYGNRIPQITAEVSKSTSHTAPYATFASDTTNYTEPTDWGHNGTVDWESQRFYKFDPGSRSIVTYDMRTMAELYRVPLQGVTADMPSNFVPSFSIGGQFMFDSMNAATNTNRGGFWLCATGELLDWVGRTSNVTAEYPMGDGTGPYNPHNAYVGNFTGSSMWLRVLTGVEQINFLYHCGNLSSNFTIWGYELGTVHLPNTPPTVPAHYSSVAFGKAEDWTPLQGQETVGNLMEFGYSHFHLLNTKNAGAGYDVYLKSMRLYNMTGMILPQGPPWVASNDPFTVEEDFVLPRPIAGEDFRMVAVAFDKSDNSLVLWGRTTANEWRFGKFLLDEWEWKWIKKDTDLDPSFADPGLFGTLSPGDAVGSPNRTAVQSNLNGGSVGWMRASTTYNTPKMYVADLSTGNVKLVVPSPLAKFAEGGFAMNAWDSDTMSLLGAPTRIFIGATGDGDSLAGIVDDVLSKTKALSPGDWDSSALTGIHVRGYSIAREANARDILQQLASAYFFDGVESDYKIKCVLRGGAPVATITEKHLAWVENRDISLKETRTQELEMPMRVTVTYSDYARNYQDGSQSAKRNSDPFPTMNAHNEQKFELPICMTATEARQIADKSLKMAWNNRMGYKLKLPWEFLKYDPTDVLTLEMTSGTTYVMRLGKMDLGVDYSLDTDAISESPAAYVSTAVGEAGEVPDQPIRFAGPCNLYILNTPLLRDLDDTLGVSSVYYASASAQSPGDFVACYIFEATDTTLAEYDNINVVTVEPTYGTVLTVLPPHSEYSLDTTSVLKVRLLSLDDEFNPDALESCTMDELLGGKNLCVVGEEVIQFMTATIAADGKTYSLTNLLRARRGTNYAVSGHTVGERFIMLEADGSIVSQLNTPSEWSSTHSFKPVPTGQFSENVNAVSVTMKPRDLMPYSPECVKATDDGTNLTITFQRRSRIANELTDFVGTIPYKEGQGSLAHFVYNVWSNKLLSDAPWDAGTTPDFTGQVAIYSGLSFADLTFSFLKAGLTKCVIAIYEVGYVDGIPKYVQLVNVPGTTEWDMTELY